MIQKYYNYICFKDTDNVLNLHEYEKCVLKTNDYSILDYGTPDEYSNGVYKYECNSIFIQLLKDDLTIGQKTKYETNKS